MSNVIDFLERAGQDAELRYATDKHLHAALHAAGVDKSAAEAIVTRDVKSLESAVGAQHNTCCGLYPVEGDQRVA
jgi:hypothetical protein